MTKRPILALAALAVAFFAAPAVADQIIDITGSGTYVFDGNLGSRLSGYSTGLKAQAISPVASPEVELGDMVFHFETGPATSIGSTDTFEFGGPVTLYGHYPWAPPTFQGTMSPAEYDSANGIFRANWIWGFLSPIDVYWLFPQLGLQHPTGGSRAYSLTATLTPTGDGVGEIDTDFRMYIEMPEPSSIALLGSGLLIGGLLRRKLLA
jgi:hypothetical protein